MVKAIDVHVHPVNRPEVGQTEGQRQMQRYFRGESTPSDPDGFYQYYKERDIMAVLLVTGPVTRNMEVPLRKTYEATPDPKLVVAVGDCARTCGVFKGSYAVAGSVDQIIPVDVFVDGCPPEPADILRGILTAIGRR
jgi:hypothetical protein